MCEPNIMKFEPAPLDSYAQRITMGVAYLGGLLTLPLFFAYLSNTRWAGLLIPIALAVPIALFLLLTYAAQPTAYIIEEDQLVVQRRWLRALKVPFSKIMGVSPGSALADVPRVGLRFAFNPGVFGYQGPFHLAPYGEAFFLATNRERLVAIARQAAVPLIVSPIRPRAFIEKLEEQRGQSALKAMAQREEAAEQRLQSGE
jgi:hypothetical protein